MAAKLDEASAFNHHTMADSHNNNNNTPSSSSSSNDNMDVLDEFLDKRLYEDSGFTKSHLSQGQPTSNKNNTVQFDVTKDEEMFSNFLTDEINKNDFMMFSSIGTPEADMIDVGSFQINSNANDISSFPLGMPKGTGNDASRQQQQQQHHFHTANNLATASNASSVGTPAGMDMSPSAHIHQEIFTTPNSTLPYDRMGSYDNSMDSNVVSSPFDMSYESARSILSNLKFGREHPAQFDNLLPKEYLEVDENSLPYKLQVQNLPGYSRVETQIKLELSISPPPPQYLIHLPADTIAKQKLCLSTDLTPQVKENILFLETFVLTTSTDKPCNICTRCIRREQKRASRRKSGVSDNLNWATNAQKRAIIFNCKELISFPPTVSANNSKIIEISSRIVCYCRHHQENKGFKLLFVIKDSKNHIVAKHVSSPIMIMDRKKNLDDNNVSNSNGALSNSANESTNTSRLQTQQPISPTSFEEDSSEPHTTDSRVFKRKRTWSPELSDGFSIVPGRKPSTTNNSLTFKREPISPQSQLSAVDHNSIMTNQSSSQKLPMVQRVIPSQGPLRGGIEVTLLGSNFKQGLTVKFGINKALSTQCWSDSTMVTYLPPAAQPGQVVVTIEEENIAASPNTSVESEKPLGGAVFTYLDDTDRQMIELALQIVGLKMNGKLEDARNIARKIIGSDGNENGGNNGTSTNSTSTEYNGNSANSLKLSSDEELVLKVINLLPKNPNWALCTPEGQTLLHLSCLKGYSKLVSSLLQKGARVDYRDANGYTPLHHASLAGDRHSIELLLNCKAKIDSKSNDGLRPEDVADPNVLDLFKCQNSMMLRKFSNSSISSSIFSVEDENIDFASGLHVSRLTTDYLTDNNETDGYDTDSSAEASNEESEGDWDDDRTDESNQESEETIVRHTPNSPTDGSLWNKVRNVFHNTSDMDDLPRYDELYPRSSNPFSFPKLGFSQTNHITSSLLDATNSNDASSSSSQQQQHEVDSTSSDEGEDNFMKFFNQRKNVQNDKMLLFFWLPLLVFIMSYFILSNVGWTFDWNEKFEDLVRRGLGTIMLGNERVKVALNKHFSQMNEAVTSVINVG